MNRIIFIILMLWSINSAFAGGGWTQDKGNGYFKLSTYFIKADQHYTSTGLVDPNITIGFLNTGFYGEYGITDRWTAITNFAFFARNYHNRQVSQTTGDELIRGEGINGVGDLDIAIKYGIVKKPKVVFAGTLQLGIPIGKTGQGEMGILQLGDGEFNQLIRFDVSTPFSLEKAQLYTTFYAGFNHRTKGFSEEVKWGAEFGAGLFKDHLWLLGKIDASNSLKNGNKVSDASSSGSSLFANDAEFISYSIEASAKIVKNFGVSFNYSGVLWARIIFAAPAYTVGVFYDLKK